MSNPKIEVEIGGKITDLEKKLGQADKKLQETGKEFGKLNEFAVGALQGIAAAFTIGAIVNFGKAVLDTTAKFQKFSAVLSNTLGSESAAAQALQSISKFASQTPFAVDELTSAFVKLSNQGFKPTISELRSLGDLASSTGKSFDQLAEAIIDAQVGEFERLKEFGIRAKKEGDNVTFTFKGVETQVNATDEAIRGYVLSLGDAVGVSGAMEKISGTLGGKLSNLGDNIESLKLAIGDKTSGVFATSIDWLNEFISLTTLAAKGVAKIREEASQARIGSVIDANKEQVLELAEAYQKIDPDLTKQGALAKAMSDVARSFREAAEGGEAFQNQNYTFSELNQINEGFNQMAVELLSVSDSAEKTGKALGLIGGLTEQIKNLNEQRDLAKDQVEVNLITAKVTALKDQLALIDEIAKRASESVKSEVGVLAPRANPFAGGLPTPMITQEVQTDPTAQMIEAVRAGKEVLANSYSEMKAQTAQFNQDISDILSNGISNTIGDFAFSIGDAIGSGADVLKAAGSALLGGLAAVLNQLGQLAIATGIGIKAIKTALETLNPAVAIGAGVALVGLAGVISSKARSLGGGMGSGSSGVGAGSSGQSFSGAGLDNSSINLNGEFIVRGTDLVYVLSQEEKKRSKG